MFGFLGSKQETLSWPTLESEADLERAIEASKERPVVLFKHSTRCSISFMAKARLQDAKEADPPQIYYLDLLAHRDISNLIAERFDVVHQSPQVIVIKDGYAIYDASHGTINMRDLIKYSK